MVKDHFFLILSAMLLKNRSVFSFLQFYVLQDDCMTATYSQFSGGIYFFQTNVFQYFVRFPVIIA